MTKFSKVIQGNETAMAIVIGLMLKSQWVQFEPMPDEHYNITVDMANASDLEGACTPAFALVQEGGSSCELYVHAHDNYEDAEADRIDCAQDGSYRTGGIVEIAPPLRALGELFYEAAEALIGTTKELTRYDGN